MPGELVFISYDQANLDSQKLNRSLVSKHIGTHYRNRSKPLQRSLAGAKGHHVRGQKDDADHGASLSKAEWPIPASVRLEPVNNICRGSQQVVAHPRGSMKQFDRVVDTELVRQDKASWTVETDETSTVQLSGQHSNATNQFLSATGALFHTQSTTLDLEESTHFEDDSGISHTNSLRSDEELQEFAYRLPAHILPLINLSCSAQQATWASFGFQFQLNYVFPHVSNWGPAPNRYTDIFAQMMLQNMDLFNAVAASAHGVYVTSILQQHQPSAAVLWHHARALSTLRMTVSERSTGSTSSAILTVFYLLENAARFNHGHEFRAHYAGLQKMIQIRGEFEPTCLEDVFANQAIVILDSSEIASTTRYALEKPIGRSLIYPDLPLKSQLHSIAVRLPFGLKRLAMEGCLSTEVIHLLSQIPTANYWANDYRASKRHAAVVEEARALLRASKQPVERMACLGVIAFSLRLVIHTHIFTESSFLDKYVQAGRRLSRSSERLYHELRLWVTLVAAEMAGSTNVTLHKDAISALVQLRRQESWIDSWSSVEIAMKKFFWSDNFLPAWKRCWDDAIDSQMTVT